MYFLLLSFSINHWYMSSNVKKKMQKNFKVFTKFTVMNKIIIQNNTTYKFSIKLSFSNIGQDKAIKTNN